MKNVLQRGFPRLIRRLARRCWSGLFLVGVVLLLPLSESPAQTEDDVLSSEDIVRSLEPPPKTRSMRAIRVQPSQPKVDLNIPFEYNSADLAPEAQRQLEELSSALLGDSLSGYRFEIAGHTDASGTSDYNRQLSDRRADSVKQFLVDKGVGEDRLNSIGYGEDSLLLADEPTHADNRRVEVKNLGTVPQN
jgi:outer membrane protein OmpA-like peptidoglycan-associated protein